jgi:hypothetical protein
MTQRSDAEVATKTSPKKSKPKAKKKPVAKKAPKKAAKPVVAKEPKPKAKRKPGSGRKPSAASATRDGRTAYSNPQPGDVLAFVGKDGTTQTRTVIEVYDAHFGRGPGVEYRSDLTGNTRHVSARSWSEWCSRSKATVYYAPLEIPVVELPVTIESGESAVISGPAIDQE